MVESIDPTDPTAEPVVVVVAAAAVAVAVDQELVVVPDFAHLHLRSCQSLVHQCRLG